MKTLQKLDVAAQLLAFIAGMSAWLYYQESHGFIYSYFLVGGVQVISCVTYLICKKGNVHGLRRHYSITLGIVAGIVAVSFFSPLILWTLFALLFVSPFLAFWYFFITLKELQYVPEKPDILDL